MSDGSQNGGGANGNGNGNGENPNPRNRRSSITQAALSNLFQRGPPSGSTGPSFSSQPNDANRRRLSVTTLGLSGTSQNGGPNLGMRRGSMSTNSNNSDSIDENAIEDDEGGARTAPTTPFARRMSYGGPAMRGYRPGGSPGNGNNPTSPPPSHPTRRPSQVQVQRQRQGSLVQGQVSAAIAERRASVSMPSSSVPQASTTKHPRHPSDNAPRSDQQGFNWSEQLRSRAESTVSGAPRPSFSMASSPPKNGGAHVPHHDRAKSVSDMPVPPNTHAAPAPKPAPRKPDAFQERILKGDFYMD